MSTLDPLFGIHAQALQVQRDRMDVLAANIANADTPNYKSRDVDFAQALRSYQEGAVPSGALATTAAGHVQADTLDASLPGMPLKWRVPMQPSTDGNTVDTQMEQASFADAALHYQASLSFLDGKLKGLLTAITGQ